jgi:RNA polymerase sigma-70 factor, ECF subfamily
MTTIMNIQSKSPPQDEVDLTRLAITGVDAFAELYRCHVNSVYRYHMAHSGNVKDAEDLTSQTFMAALEGIQTYRGTGSFAAWLMGIASRKRLMFFRGRKPEVPIEAALHLPTPGLPTDKAAFQHLQIEKVHHALKQISPERAEAIILCYFGGLSNFEISQLLKKSESAVKMLISRGLQDLRERTSLALEVEE